MSEEESPIRVAGEARLIIFKIDFERYNFLIFKNKGVTK